MIRFSTVPEGEISMTFRAAATLRCEKQVRTYVAKSVVLMRHASLVTWSREKSDNDAVDLDCNRVSRNLYIPKTPSCFLLDVYFRSTATAMCWAFVGLSIWLQDKIE